MIICWRRGGHDRVNVKEWFRGKMEVGFRGDGVAQKIVEIFKYEMFNIEI